MRKFEQLSYEEVNTLYKELMKLSPESIGTSEYVIIDEITDELKEELEIRG